MTRNSALRMGEELQLFSGREFVIERDQDAAAEENRVGGDQPFGLIGHDDGGACAVSQSGILQRARQGQRLFFELAIGEARVFAIAIGFDQADFIWPAIERGAQRFAERIVLAEIQHYRRD